MVAGTGHTSIRTYHLYLEGSTPSTNVYADGQINFVDIIDGTPFTSQGMILANDNSTPGADITFSFDGVHLGGRAKAGDRLTFDFRRETVIYLASGSASAYRLWVW